MAGKGELVPAPDLPNGKTVAVLGGGLAGLSAARTLLERGFRVSLVEKRPFLGGRAYSFHSHEVDMEVDNGQHVFMGCCTYYIDFIKTLGAYENAFLQDSLRAASRPEMEEQAPSRARRYSGRFTFCRRSFDIPTWGPSTSSARRTACSGPG